MDCVYLHLAALGFFLRHLHDAHRDGKFMHSVAPWCMNAASAACPRLMPPSLAGTAWFVQIAAAPLPAGLQIFQQQFVLENSAGEHDGVDLGVARKLLQCVAKTLSNSSLKRARNFLRLPAAQAVTNYCSEAADENPVRRPSTGNG